jgi:hypothetical protein
MWTKQKIETQCPEKAAIVEENQFPVGYQLTPKDWAAIP